MRSAPGNIVETPHAHMPDLDRHEQWRGQDVPTLSCILGPRDAAINCWQRYYAERGVPSLVTASFQETGLVDSAVALAFGGNGARDRFIQWLAARSGREATQVGALLHHDAPAEKRLFLAQSGCRTSDWAVLRHSPGLRALAPTPDPRYHTLEHAMPLLAEILGRDSLPALLLCPTDQADAEAVKCETAFVEALFARLPSLRVGIAMAPSQGEWLCRELAGTRQGALFEEGMITLETPQPDAGGAAAPDEAEATRRIARMLVPSARATAISAWRETAESFGAARPRNRKEKDRFRSAVERFLYLMLESHPDTRGRFQVNQCVNTRSGRLPRTEVDFLAPMERLAVEVDGWHHFRDAAAWRRDRLKDLTLQQEGYMVARYLAEDVMNAIDTVMNSIICALEEAAIRRREHA